MWCHQKTNIPPAQWHFTSLPLSFYIPKYTCIFMCTFCLSLVHPLIYVGHSVYIDRYFQCLGPQEISLGNFQRTDRPTFLPLNWNGWFPSLLVWHLYTKWHSDVHKWTQSWTSCMCGCVQQQGLTLTPITVIQWNCGYRWTKAYNMWKLWPLRQLSTHIIIQLKAFTVRESWHHRRWQSADCRDPGELKLRRMTSSVTHSVTHTLYY